MMELCGYETIIQGDSGFCNVFTDDEWLDGEWYFDVSPEESRLVAKDGDV